MNSFGRLFRLSIFGESHGAGVGVVIDGCPAGIPLVEGDFTADLERRRSGAAGTTARREPDEVACQSGIFEGKTTGAPLTLWIRNLDVDSTGYLSFRETPRPGHADFVAAKKYGGFSDFRGSGHFSGRLTAALVAAGVVAKKIISPTLVTARLIEVGGSTAIEAVIAKVVASGDSVGGRVSCTVTGVPIGIGEPFFDSLESLLAHAMFSIPAIRGVEFGAGFRAATMVGSESNDTITDRHGRTATNHAGGINGGISNGNAIEFAVAVKPASSIKVPQNTVNLTTGATVPIEVQGRHDACIARRVPPVVEALTAAVLADCLLIEQRAARVR